MIDCYRTVNRIHSGLQIHPKSTVLAGSVSNCHQTVTVHHIEACRQLDWVSFFSLSTPMSQLSLRTYLSFWFAAFNFCELYVLTRILIFVLAMHPLIRSDWCFILSGSITEQIGQSSSSHLAGQQWSVRCLVQHSALLAKNIKGERAYSSYHRFLCHFRSNWSFGKCKIILTYLFHSPLIALLNIGLIMVDGLVSTPTRRPLYVITDNMLSRWQTWPPSLVYNQNRNAACAIHLYWHDGAPQARERWWRNTANYESLIY